MRLLKETVHRAILQTDRAQAFASLRSKLAELHIPIEEEDKIRGEIAARCLTNVMDMVFGVAGVTNGSLKSKKSIKQRRA